MIQLTAEEFFALSDLARKGASDVDHLRGVEAFLGVIAKRSGLVTYLLWVQWQEADYALPPTARFPDKWPPELRTRVVRSDRAIAKSDVQAALTERARKPVEVLVTRDPGGVVGWTPIDAFFVT